MSTQIDFAHHTDHVRYAGDDGYWRQVLGVSTLACLALAPWWADRAMLRVLAEGFSYLALASLWNLLGGFAGLVSIGQQVFVGVGGYVLYFAALNTELYPLVGLAFAASASGVLAIPVALLLFRLRGAQFTIGSWVIAEIFLLAFQQVRAVGGGLGITLPATVVRSIAPDRMAREAIIYLTFLALTVATLWLIVLVLRSRHGLALRATRDSMSAAQACGVDVDRTRSIVFVATASATGALGAMVFLQKLSITPFSAFSINEWTMNVIFITVIGGKGRVEGPIVGTLVFFALRQWLSDYGALYFIVLGCAGITVMLTAPQGIWGALASRFGWQLFPMQRQLRPLPP